MIKFIVLFSLALAGHKARGLMLRGSGQILQRPNFINSESQLDAKKSFLQSNKKKGKSLLKTNLYLQQDEDKQEQSYLQGEEEEEIKLVPEQAKRQSKKEKKIRVLLQNIGKDVDAHEIYKGLYRVKFKGHSRFNVLDRVVGKIISGDDEEKHKGDVLLRTLKQIGEGRVKYSKDDLKDTSMRILYLIEGREKAIKDQLARIGEEGNAENIDKGLSHMHVWIGYVEYKYLTKLVKKCKKGETLDKEEARECIKKLNEFGSDPPRHAEAKELTNRIKRLVDPGSLF